MRRWLACLLLVLVPIQLSWAAVASYCNHPAASLAAGPAADHLGHHDHAGHAHGQPDDRPAPQANPADEGGSAPAGMNHDCGHCHGHCAMMAVSFGSALATPPVHGLPAGAQGTSPARAPTPPERPQWPKLA